jgi:hypothetical protein
MVEFYMNAHHVEEDLLDHDTVGVSVGNLIVNLTIMLLFGYVYFHTFWRQPHRWRRISSAFKEIHEKRETEERSLQRVQ